MDLVQESRGEEFFYPGLLYGFLNAGFRASEGHRRLPALNAGKGRENLILELKVPDTNKEFAFYSFNRSFELPGVGYGLGIARTICEDGMFEMALPEKERKNERGGQIEVKRAIRCRYRPFSFGDGRFPFKM